MACVEAFVVATLIPMMQYRKDQVSHRVVFVVMSFFRNIDDFWESARVQRGVCTVDDFEDACSMLRYRDGR